MIAHARMVNKPLPSMESSEKLLAVCCVFTFAASSGGHGASLTLPNQIRIDMPVHRWALADGRLELPQVLPAFVEFLRAHGMWMVRGQTWPEAAQQIVLTAFVRRLANGGGYMESEYSLGRRRLDLLIRWFTAVDENGLPLGEDRNALELTLFPPKKQSSTRYPRQIVASTPPSAPPTKCPRTPTSSPFC